MNIIISYAVVVLEEVLALPLRVFKSRELLRVIIQPLAELLSFDEDHAGQSVRDGHGLHQVFKKVVVLLALLELLFRQFRVKINALELVSLQLHEIDYAFLNLVSPLLLVYNILIFKNKIILLIKFDF